MLAAVTLLWDTLTLLQQGLQRLISNGLQKVYLLLLDQLWTVQASKQQSSSSQHGWARHPVHMSDSCATWGHNCLPIYTHQVSSTQKHGNNEQCAQLTVATLVSRLLSKLVMFSAIVATAASCMMFMAMNVVAAFSSCAILRKLLATSMAMQLLLSITGVTPVNPDLTYACIHVHCDHGM